jgi:O-acetyl-ADP-ribose deacetylase (regulator of RNase III)
MVHNVIGNLLDSNCDYICHQVNCQGVMGSGIAKQIRERWPEVYESYKELCTNHGAMTLLGTIDIVGTKTGRDVINMFSQFYYGYNGNRFTSYDAFCRALEQIRDFIKPNSTIGFPKNIGCGLGGGNWKVISALIEEILGKDYEVYIYEYFGE